MLSVLVKNFEGPLDLLLQLIEDRKVAITQISIAEVADQYLGYLHTKADWNPDELADFLVIAAKLIVIKSKALLPTLDLGDDDRAAEELERQLKLYKTYADAAKTIASFVHRKHIACFRDAPLPVERRFVPPRNVTLTTLRTLFERVLVSLEPFLPLPKSVIAATISIQEKIATLKQTILERISTTFHALVVHHTSKTDVIVSFLALLELVKQRVVTVNQDSLFQDIHIAKQ